MKHNSNLSSPYPFLKWVGGKRQLLSELVSRFEMTQNINSYFEPFVGGGALFFELIRSNKIINNIYISDINNNLISTYIGIRDNLEEVIDLLQFHKIHHDREYYYKIRSTKYLDIPQLAARFIYLNKTCFNGLYRENKKGEFNVPMGSYINPNILDLNNLKVCSSVLKNVNIQVCNYESTIEHMTENDFVYLDPPYYPLSKTSSFTSYDKNDFKEIEQKKLFEFCKTINELKVNFLLSNSDCEFINELYKDHFKIDKIFANRTINSKSESRGKITEVIISNYC